MQWMINLSLKSLLLDCRFCSLSLTKSLISFVTHNYSFNQSFSFSISKRFSSNTFSFLLFSSDQIPIFSWSFQLKRKKKTLLRICLDDIFFSRSLYSVGERNACESHLMKKSICKENARILSQIEHLAWNSSKVFDCSEKYKYFRPNTIHSASIFV